MLAMSLQTRITIVMDQVQIREFLNDFNILFSTVHFDTGRIAKQKVQSVMNGCALNAFIIKVSW